MLSSDHTNSQINELNQFSLHLKNQIVECKETIETCQKLENQIFKSNNIYDKLKFELEEIDADQECLDTNSEEFDSKMFEIIEEIEVAKEKNNQISKKCEEIEIQIAISKTGLLRGRENKKCQIDQKLVLSKYLQQMTRELSLMSSNSDSKNTSQVSMLKKSHLESLKTDRTKAENDRDNLDEKTKSMKTEIQISNKKIATLKSETSEAMGSLDQLNQTNGNLIKQLNEMKSQIQSIQSQTNTCLQRNAYLTDIYNQLQNSNRDLGMDNMDDRLESLITRNDEIDKQLAIVETSNEQVLQKLKVDTLKKNQQIQEWSAHMARLKQNFVQKEKDTAEQLRGQIIEQKKISDQLKLKLKPFEEKDRGRKLTIQADQRAMQEKVKKSNQTLQNITQSIEKNKNDSKTSQNLLHEFTDSQAQMETDIIRSEDEIRKLKNDLREPVQNKKELEEKLKNNQKMLYHVQTDLEEIELQKHNSEIKTKKLESAKIKTYEDLELINGQINRSEVEQQILQAQLDNCEKRQRELIIQSEQKMISKEPVGKMTKKIEQIKDTINQLENILHDTMETNENIQLENEEITDQIAQIEEKIQHKDKFLLTQSHLKEQLTQFKNNINGRTERFNSVCVKAVCTQAQLFSIQAEIVLADENSSFLAMQLNHSITDFSNQKDRDEQRTLEAQQKCQRLSRQINLARLSSQASVNNRTTATASISSHHSSGAGNADSQYNSQEIAYSDAHHGGNKRKAGGSASRPEEEEEKDTHVTELTVKVDLLQKEARRLELRHEKLIERLSKFTDTRLKDEILLEEEALIKKKNMANGSPSKSGVKKPISTAMQGSNEFSFNEKKLQLINQNVVGGSRRLGGGGSSTPKAESNISPPSNFIDSVYNIKRGGVTSRGRGNARRGLGASGALGRGGTAVSTRIGDSSVIKSGLTANTSRSSNSVGTPGSSSSAPRRLAPPTSAQIRSTKK